jgi:hypothetical protein
MSFSYSHIIPNSNTPSKSLSNSKLINIDIDLSEIEEDLKEISVNSRFSDDDDDLTDLNKIEKYQEDIILTEEQKDILFGDADVGTRTGLIDEKYRWEKDNKGFVIVPYELSQEAQYCEFLNLYAKINFYT